jgi:hypothetical protein
VPEEFRKWIPAVIEYSCKMFAFSLAMTIQQVISAYTSALKGGRMFGLKICEFLKRKDGFGQKFLVIDTDNSMIDEALGYAAVGAGLYSGVTKVYKSTLQHLAY